MQVNESEVRNVLKPYHALMVIEFGGISVIHGGAFGAELEPVRAWGYASLTGYLLGSAGIFKRKTLKSVIKKKYAFSEIIVKVIPE